MLSFFLPLDKLNCMQWEKSSTEYTLKIYINFQQISAINVILNAAYLPEIIKHIQIYVYKYIFIDIRSKYEYIPDIINSVIVKSETVESIRPINEQFNIFSNTNQGEKKKMLVS